jgi:hypothetical protein
LLSKVVFSTLYADVKEHMPDHLPSKRFDLEFFRLLVSNIKMVSFAEREAWSQAATRKLFGRRRAKWWA